MKFSDLPKFTQQGSYRVNVDWKYLEEMLENYFSTKGGMSPLDLNPDFQRGHVWAREQQTAYVEYILKGGVSGREIYLNCNGWMGSYKGPFVIVDGKQRLEAVRAFLRNEVPVFNYYFKDFTDRLPTGSAFFCININNLKTRKEVLQWYLEMNTGGVVHTKEELNRVKNLLEMAEKQ